MTSSTPARNDTAYGSDVIADLLRDLDIAYLAINPGASFRGLHDSIVNHLGNERPRLVLTLHEAQAVALAHGYAKVSGKPMGVVLHANVGLMNAVMAIYDAFVDRVPMLIIGATGAVDAARRRPWIEWVHTSRDQGALIRNFVKWDDQPASVAAALESIARAWTLTRTPPHAPTYVCLDVTLQEDLAPAALPRRDLSRNPLPAEPTIAQSDLGRAAAMLREAVRPLILIGRHERSEAAWKARIALAELLGARVICDQKSGVGFPSAHPLFVAAPAQYPSAAARDILSAADAILSLDWPDLAGTLTARPGDRERAKIIVVSPDEALHNGWSLDHFGLPDIDLKLPVRPEVFTGALNAMLPPAQPRPAWGPARTDDAPEKPNEDGTVTLRDVALAFDAVRGNTPVCLTRLPFGWPDALTRFEGPLDCIGYDGGGGIGSTPGITVGAALALKGTGRVPVAILGDGDLVMGSQALWTVAAEKLPALFIVNNNRSFHNDVEHQETIARHRERPVERRTIGMMMDDPPIDFVALAKAHGLVGLGPVTEASALRAALADGFELVCRGGAVLVDIRVVPPKRG